MRQGFNEPYVKTYDKNGECTNEISKHNPLLHRDNNRRKRRENVWRITNIPEHLYRIQYIAVRNLDSQKIITKRIIHVRNDN